MLGLRLFSRLALHRSPCPACPPRSPCSSLSYSSYQYPDTIRTLQVSLTHRVIRRWHILIPDLEDLEGPTSKEPIPAYATVSHLIEHKHYVTSRLDKQDHQIEGLGTEIRILGKEMKESFRDLGLDIQETKEEHP